jgi:hypothetical protein
MSASARTKKYCAGGPNEHRNNQTDKRTVRGSSVWRHRADSARQQRVAAPCGDSARQQRVAAPCGGSARQQRVAAPCGGSARQRPVAAPCGDSARQQRVTKGGGGLPRRHTSTCRRRCSAGSSAAWYARGGTARADSGLYTAGVLRAHGACPVCARSGTRTQYKSLKMFE